ncbi:MAG: Beta-lactamase class A protein [Candidatus Tokpelaia hoelldobleri]|uniref:Beta-lactamase n=1 Tax=Candidatus Tokpelaia hoelldobleri TaxID=1902579 RepID=A0A1U9JTU4_9HYPH|nr:MAG: Beta-lactamase class A protein [Candidatus Tokpelaia hoelldoblerii]
MDRRKFLMLGGAGLIMSTGVAQSATSTAFLTFCKELERQSGGRLGVYVLDSRSKQEFSYRGDERFAMCSVFKWLLAAAVLARVDAGQEKLDRIIRFKKADLMEYSPGTKQFVDGPGMSIAQLCKTAITISDNTATNLLLDKSLQGLAALNAFLHSKGDNTTRLDRLEPDLNEARPGDERDTTTPEAMGGNLQRFLTGGSLSTSSRKQLTEWMLATRTSGERLRSGLPSGWRLADKTGTGSNGTANDVGVYWTPTGEPVFVCVFLTETSIDRAEQSKVIADIGKKIRKI